MPTEIWKCTIFFYLSRDCFDVLFENWYILSCLSLDPDRDHLHYCLYNVTGNSGNLLVICYWVSWNLLSNLSTLSVFPFDLVFFGQFSSVSNFLSVIVNCASKRCLQNTCFTNHSKIKIITWGYLMHYYYLW